MASVLNEFWDIYEHLAERGFMNEYRMRSNVIGKEIRFLERDKWKEARALDIDNDGGLIVEWREASGQKVKQILHTGEITLRIKNGLQS